MLYDFYSKVLSNLHTKLECVAFLGTKGTAEASCAREPQYCHCMLKSRCGPNSWWCKITRVKAAGGGKELWSKLLSAQNYQTFFLQTAALTRVLVRH